MIENIVFDGSRCAIDGVSVDEMYECLVVARSFPVMKDLTE